MGSVTQRVEDAIRELVASGALGPNGKLPSERTLSHDLDAGRTTVRLVLSKLAAEGIIRSEHGRGYFATGDESIRREDSSEDSGLRPWIIRGERTIYDNRWVRLTLMDVEPPGVERFEHHVVRLHHVAIAAVVDDHDRVLMLWRYRFVPDKWGWELPGGNVDAGEDAGKTAAREVEEETGWRPNGPLQHLVTFQPMVGMVDSPHDIYLGEGAHYTAPPSDVEESGHVAWIPLADVPEMIERDELLGSGTLVALLHILATRKLLTPDQ
ncbi:NUDIX domain-containing protein [Lipingzhangella sp. LS1_29]|uniref:NUDIX domain-containing protein n=1 Tax=Lipingzhangella rawalii TaxID=2055835 RepID=A0ABU2H8Y6_9ACTN|nr:NUDIX domain-containing protein [Lipingzhangella rawalii]MDS1271767.1 NUDIX domain-containing protein [Lipingzhangella rawalii]